MDKICQLEYKYIVTDGDDPHVYQYKKKLTLKVKVEDLTMLHCSLPLKVVGMHSYMLWIPVYFYGYAS